MIEYLELYLALIVCLFFTFLFIILIIEYVNLKRKECCNKNIEKDYLEFIDKYSELHVKPIKFKEKISNIKP